MLFALVTFIAAIIMSIVRGAQLGGHAGWTTMAIGVVATGIAWKVEDILDAIILRIRRC